MTPRRPRSSRGSDDPRDLRDDRLPQDPRDARDSRRPGDHRDTTLVIVIVSVICLAAAVGVGALFFVVRANDIQDLQESIQQSSTRNQQRIDNNAHAFCNFLNTRARFDGPFEHDVELAREAAAIAVRYGCDKPVPNNP